MLSDRNCQDRRTPEYRPSRLTVFTALPDVKELCQRSLVMAQQHSYLELETFSHINPEEFVQAFTKDNLAMCYKDLLCPGFQQAHLPHGYAHFYRLTATRQKCKLLILELSQPHLLFK
ncbi:hypothetical protein OTU49_009630 [Cherax quadricarinatus]|uniref:Uncharacterized protein n=1 Tax=Cherax quadricarinatus TaxID=27406 RepID=A0AAW0W9U7_CHEQU